MKHILLTLALSLFFITSTHGQGMVKYKVANYPNGVEELKEIVTNNIRISQKLFTNMVDENINRVSANVALIINSKGVLVAFEVQNASHPLFDEKSFPNLIKDFKKKSFIPGSINDKPSATVIVLEDIQVAIAPSI